MLVVKMLVVVVALFATLWFSYRFLVVYNSFATHHYMELWFLMFCKTMIFINSAINPILYNAMSIKFRKAFKRLLSCGKRHINHATS
ncbi:thyrotropin-releasing hormone receptor [Caerostris darwini]|uniref:Thyrotropin-releasing hormone receptor n=1 Tax=Caerostris darwini TaxID=1538125 RepID=A0AAV4WWW2_9ARAC|nr:thyrotropin-releasing hormone receptor [Caerostris darwini]